MSTDDQAQYVGLISVTIHTSTRETLVESSSAGAGGVTSGWTPVRGSLAVGYISGWTLVRECLVGGSTQDRRGWSDSVSRASTTSESAVVPSEHSLINCRNKSYQARNSASQFESDDGGHTADATGMLLNSLVACDTWWESCHRLVT